MTGDTLVITLMVFWSFAIINSGTLSPSKIPFPDTQEFMNTTQIKPTRATSFDNYTLISTERKATHLSISSSSLTPISPTSSAFTHTILNSSIFTNLETNVSEEQTSTILRTSTRDFTISSQLPSSVTNILTASTNQPSSELKPTLPNTTQTILYSSISAKIEANVSETENQMVTASSTVRNFTIFSQLPSSATNISIPSTSQPSTEMKPTLSHTTQTILDSSIFTEMGTNVSETLEKETVILSSTIPSQFPSSVTDILTPSTNQNSSELKPTLFNTTQTILDSSISTKMVTYVSETLVNETITFPVTATTKFSSSATNFNVPSSTQNPSINTADTTILIKNESFSSSKPTSSPFISTIYSNNSNTTYSSIVKSDSISITTPISNSLTPTEVNMNFTDLTSQKLDTLTSTVIFPSNFSTTSNFPNSTHQYSTLDTNISMSSISVSDSNNHTETSDEVITTINTSSSITFSLSVTTSSIDPNTISTISLPASSYLTTTTFQPNGNKTVSEERKPLTNGAITALAVLGCIAVVMLILGISLVIHRRQKSKSYHRWFDDISTQENNLLTNERKSKSRYKYTNPLYDDHGE